MGILRGEPLLTDPPAKQPALSRDCLKKMEALEPDPGACSGLFFPCDCVAQGLRSHVAPGPDRRIANGPFRAVDEPFVEEDPFRGEVVGADGAVKEARLLCQGHPYARVRRARRRGRAFSAPGHRRPQAIGQRQRSGQQGPEKMTPRHRSVTLSEAKGLAVRFFAALRMTLLNGCVAKRTNVVHFDLGSPRESPR